MNPTPIIVTHMTLDWDAITACWLLNRFHPELREASFSFVAQNDETSPLLLSANAVVDTGLCLDPSRLRFDHHQEGLGKSTCASKQVYEHLCAQSHAPDTARRLEALEPLVTLVYKSDTAQFDIVTETSNSVGLHALLSGERKRVRRSLPPQEWDDSLLRFGFSLLDGLALELGERLRWKSETRGETVFLSSDGRVAATRHGNNTQLFEQGAVLVIYEGEPIVVSGGGMTYPVGVARAFDATEPHIGNLLTQILDAESELSPTLRGELESWWHHPSGFMGGRGSSRAPRATPVAIDISEVASLIDRHWKR